MSNPVLDAMREANERQWCVSLYCTTCGALDYRKRLRESGGPLGAHLVDHLAAIDIDELMAIPRWQEALVIAVIDTPFVGVALEAWLAKAKGNIRFADETLYNIIRSVSSREGIRIKWVNVCMAMAIESKDFSLVESLVLVLGRDSMKYPELIDVAMAHAKRDVQMRRVLFNACGLRVRA